MKRTSLVLATFAFLTACGGSDAVTIDVPDTGGGNDTGTGVDTGTGNDSGTVTDASVGDAIAIDGTTIDAGPFQVGNVPGLVLWLNAGKGVSTNQGGVDLWVDQSPAKNDAKQGIQARRPTPVSNGINGLPTVHFERGQFNGPGQMLVVADSPSLQWGTGDFFVIVVGRFDNNPQDGNGRGVGVFFTKQANQTNFPGPFLSGNIPGQINPTLGLDFATSTAIGNFVISGTAYNNNAAHAFAGQRVGTKLDLRVDSASIASSTSSGNDVSNAGNAVRIGADGDAAFYRLNGDISEIIAVKGALSANDQAGIQSYLKTKYALP